MPKLKTQEQYLKDIINTHGDKYIYDKVEYTKKQNKVCIECKTHGIFWQIAADHLNGRGCPKCATENHRNYNLKDSLKEENRDKPLDFYLIELSKDEETFLKIGLSKEVKTRHRNIKNTSGYIVSDIMVFQCTVEEGTIIEDKILNSLKKKFKYKPSIKFPGYTECLHSECRNLVIKELGEILEKDFDRHPIVSKILDFTYGKK
jgi:hypothetical protein